VSSGAVGVGMGVLGLEKKPQCKTEIQVCLSLFLIE
jgi:glutamate 5-kinase